MTECSVRMPLKTGALFLFIRLRRYLFLLEIHISLLFAHFELIGKMFSSAFISQPLVTLARYRHLYIAVSHRYFTGRCSFQVSRSTGHATTLPVSLLINYFIEEKILF